MTTRAYIFAGGGTGGHLYPGLAIARKLTSRAREMDGVAHTLFVCSQRPLDSKILEQEGVAYRAISAVPMSVKPKGLVRFGVTWARAVGESRAIIRGLEHEIGREGGLPVVVAMGGFVAAPVVRAAQKEGCRIVLVNLDAEPGKANRLIARVAAHEHKGGGGIYSAALVDAKARGKARHWQTIGPIVRDAALAPPAAGMSQAECRAKLGLDPDRPTLMVTGGSQGAQSINDFVVRFFESHPDVRTWQVLHQTGKDPAEAVAQRYQAVGVRAVVQEFVSVMGLWWGSADAAVARAGAGSVAEAWANRVPTLFMPYPYHRDEHQRKNAAGLVSAGAAAVVRDEIDARRNVDGSAGGALISIMTDPARREAMKAALAGLGPADGADRVAKALWALPLSRASSPA